MSLPFSDVDLGNIQGLVFEPYRYRLSRYLLFSLPKWDGPYVSRGAQSWPTW
jgi:hypothetical protein